MGSIYISKKQILAIHQILIQKYGGSFGLREEALLESAIAQPKQTAFGKDLYPGIQEKAAAYAFFLCQHHPFVDGNKRVAASTMGTFLIANGYRLTCSPEKLYTTMMKLARHDLSLAELTTWVKNNSIK